MAKSPWGKGWVKNKGPAFGPFGKASQKPYKQAFWRAASPEYFAQFYSPYVQQSQQARREAMRGMQQAVGVGNAAPLARTATAQQYLSSQYPQLQNIAEVEQIRRMNLARDPWLAQRERRLRWWLARQNLGLTAESLAAQLGMMGAQAGGGGFLSSFL